jgi:hypothetical protein
MNAVGGEGLQRAQLPPMGKGAGVPKEFLHQGLVVAAQADRVIFDHADSQLVDDGLRIRTAIDVIAQINLDHVLNRPAPDILVDAYDSLCQQIGPAVDIADRIDARICRRRGGKGVRIGRMRWPHGLRSSIMEPLCGQS